MDMSVGLAGCVLPERIYEEYPVSTYGIYASQSGNAIADTHDGMIDEIIACGQSSAAPGTGKRISDPYTDQLVLLDGMNDVFSSKGKIYLEGLEIFVYDPKIIGQGAPQDLTVNNEVQNSISLVGNTLAQSLYRFGMMPQWQPNWLNPMLTIDGRRFMTGAGRTSHKARRSIGLPHPVCRKIGYELDKIQNIDFQVQCGSWIPTAEKIRRMYCVGILWFRLRQ